jgi:PAS domain S-box-containing protein
MKFEKSDAVLIGPNVKDPVNIAQLIHSSDKRVPIIILCNAARCAMLRQDLMFSPFVGHEIIVWPTTDVDGVADVIADAAERRLQRQRYQEAAMANAHVQLEVLPLLCPETAEYVGGLFDYEPIGVVAVTPDATIITINRHARQLLQISDQDAHGSSLLNLFPKDERGRLQNLLSLAIKTNGRLAPELFEFPAAKDRLSFIEVTTSAFSNPAGRHGAMVVLQEVTLRVQSERQRTEAVVELKLIANALRTMHAISTGVTGSLSEKILGLLRLGCEQFGLPIGILSKVEGDTLTVLEAVSESSTYSSGAASQLEFNFCAATILSVEPIAVELASGTPWRNHPAYLRHGWEAYLGTRIIVDGEVFGTLCFMSRAPHRSHFSTADREILKLMSRWISGELQRERAAAHMRKLSSAVEQTADSVIITDCEGVVEYVNLSFELLTGYTRDEVVGSTANFLMSDEKIKVELWDAIKRGLDFRFLLNGRTKNGKLYHEQMTITPLKNETGRTTHLIATGQDVTALIEAKEQDRKRQAELTHVARLSTLGGMVSGLAHELNQPLCAITTYAQTCLRKMRAGEAHLSDLQHGLNQIVRQAERADEIFSRIRNFSRKSQMRRQRADIREIIETTIGFIQTELDHNNVQLKLSFPRTTQLVFADAIQIQQVVLNLVRNSLDALSATADREKCITIKVASEDRNFTKVTVSDTGPGCPSEELHRVFEPFFTTKDAGLGVGLSISQAIVEGHGGKLWLSSSSPQGSTFCLTLPTWNKKQHATDYS